MKTPETGSFIRTLIALLGLITVLTGCGGGGAKADIAGTNAKLAGNWQIQLRQLSPPSPAVKTESGFLVQSGDSLAGTVVLGADTLCPGLGTVQGKVSGTNVAIAVTQIAQTVDLTGTASNDGSTMSGNYTIVASGCGGGSTSGTWTGTQVKPFSGSYQVTFTSGEGQGVYNFTIQVDQAQNSGSSTSNLTGTMSSSAAPCGAKFSIAGVIGGTSLVLNFLASDGSSVGQLKGTVSTDATSLTGAYDFLAQDQVCSGDAGTIAIAPSSH